MPNFDGGHYFLTALLPISTNILTDRGQQRLSPIQMVRKSLAILPTALQTPASTKIGLNSPFSRNRRTHFARFVVIEDVTYNGRDPMDAIKVAITGVNPVLPQPQDGLFCPFLLFVADFDADSGDPAELAAYLKELWATMQPELVDVFGHCVGFQKTVTGDDFASYIQRGQIETTMPFNDYWTTAPPLRSLKKELVGVLLGFVVAGLLVGAIFGYQMGGWIWGLAGFVIGLVLGAVLGLASAYILVMKSGAKPLPTAPNTTLPSILKALYLQQKFTPWAIDAQSLDDAQLYAAFGDFIRDHQPGQPMPSQLPGVIKF